MTEPREIADQAEEVVDGLYHWHIHNSNIGGAISSSHALVYDDACVLIDPVRLAAEALAALPRPDAVVLTARCHQRAAWRYRRELGAEVWLPADAPAADEEPDRRYAEGDTLPGGLVAVRTPGPEWPHYSFLRAAEPGVLFCSDLVVARRRRRCCTSCLPSTTTTRPRPGAASSGCSSCRSPSSASTTARRCSTIPRRPCGGCWLRRRRGEPPCSPTNEGAYPVRPREAVA